MAHGGDSLILTLVAAFVLAFLFGLGALRLKLSPLVGYLLAGVAVGPFTPGQLADSQLAGQLAEIGVILLMFGVGLHFSPRDLLAVRRAALPGALVQVSFGAALGWGLGRLIGMGDGEALLLGLSLGIASSVVVLRTLEERHELKTETGRIAIGWLVVQDLFAVIALVLLPLLAGRDHADLWTSAGQIIFRLAKIGVFMGLMWLVGGRVLPWLLVGLAHTRSRELFTLGVLAIALGIAWLAYAAFGASFALGAFVAGLVLNGSPLGHNAAERSLPLRDAFAVLFFVSVGMLFDPSIIVRQPLAVAGVLFVVLASGLAAALALRLGGQLDHTKAALLAGSIPQIGEFSFLLAALAVSLGAMSRAGHSLIVIAAILSIALNPLVVWTVHKAVGRR
ncbi:cation:proton antiporter [Phenylobacterium sp. LjRoot219]|uniref:cation:proton antiporter domain-containing protein n=1 Tax=Phenylobacterium sp. LjRoot219 TaxID=3342283 RepID=UPI003ECC2C94